MEWMKVQRIMKASEITDEFRKLAFANFVTEGKHELILEAHDCALEYYQRFDEIHGNRQNSLSLLGQPGTGKTHLITAVANSLMRKKGVPVLYFPYVEGFNDLRDDLDELEVKLEKMKSIDVLFIDDLFKPVNKKPRATEWQIEQMYAVINHRYINHKPIMVSSELNVSELIIVDEALGTRIYEMCRDFTVVLEGDPLELNHRLEGLEL